MGWGRSSQTNKIHESIKKTNMNSIEINETNELVKKTEIPETPFTIVELDGKFFGAMGQYRLTELWDEYETAQAELLMMSWNNILKVIMVVLDATEKTNSTNLN